MRPEWLIASTAPRSGKSIVSLGMMEVLSGYANRVGFFRPVVPVSAADDQEIRLIADRYRLEFAPEALYGCTIETARNYAAAGRFPEAAAAAERAIALAVETGDEGLAGQVRNRLRSYRLERSPRER